MAICEVEYTEVFGAPSLVQYFENAEEEVGVRNRLFIERAIVDDHLPSLISLRIWFLRHDPQGRVVRQFGGTNYVAL